MLDTLAHWPMETSKSDWKIPVLFLAKPTLRRRKVNVGSSRIWVVDRHSTSFLPIMQLMRVCVSTVTVPNAWPCLGYLSEYFQVPLHLDASAKTKI